MTIITIQGLNTRPTILENPSIDDMIFYRMQCIKYNKTESKRLSDIAKANFPEEYRINPGQKFLLKLEATIYVADTVGGCWNRIKSSIVRAFHFLVYSMCMSYDSRYYPRPEKYPFKDFEDMQFCEQYKKTLIKKLMDEQ